MLELNELIDQHVENYYDLKGFEGSPGGLELRLVECGFGTDLPISAGQIVSILKNPKTRFAGIRHLIVSIIVKNIGYKAGIEFSLLSPKISTFSQSMPPVERQPGCEEGTFAHTFSMSHTIPDCQTPNPSSLFNDYDAASHPAEVPVCRSFKMFPRLGYW